MLRPITANDLPSLASLAVSLGGFWTRAAFSSSMPPPPFEVALRSSVVTQLLSTTQIPPTVDGSRADPAILASGICGVLALIEPDWRSSTAFLDLAFPIQVDDLGSVSAAMDIAVFEEDLWLFMRTSAADWPFRRAILRMPNPLSQCIDLPRLGFQLVSELRDAVLWRGSYWGIDLYQYDLVNP